jgi:acyl-CoA synthetase (AMP-forming)/AMP-acid ligase II
VGPSSSEYPFNRWFHTGDEVKFDEQGELYIVDRLKARENLHISEAVNHADTSVLS